MSDAAFNTCYHLRHMFPVLGTPVSCFFVPMLQQQIPTILAYSLSILGGVFGLFSFQSLFFMGEVSVVLLRLTLYTAPLVPVSFLYHLQAVLPYLLYMCIMML